jgi:ATP-dependent exoDNAse (exonuclease V) beta subunit
VGIQDGTLPLRLSESALPDEAAEEAHVQQEMKLLYVAATRARDRLLVTGYGKVPAWAVGAGK